MSGFLELEKIKRTGFWPAVFGGGILAALVPVINTAVREEVFLQQDGSALEILMNENWQMMAMLNLFFLVASACLLYHTEYADNAIQRMCTLPQKENKMFLNKFVLMCGFCLIALAIEGAGLIFSAVRWFPADEKILLNGVLNMGYAFVLLLPGTLFMLLISAACKNMWISLGIGVICVFTATMLPADHFILSLFPFAMPFQIFAGTVPAVLKNYWIAVGAECAIGCFAAVIFFKVRRLFS
ncbi:MAG: ABC transporter permease [Lachnospiraceae bacterium]|nr:ABC transporter permease [Lachnospiraceae bacterium]